MQRNGVVCREGPCGAVPLRCHFDGVVTELWQRNCTEVVPLRTRAVPNTGGSLSIIRRPTADYCTLQTLHRSLPDLCDYFRRYLHLPLGEKQPVVVCI